MLFSRLAVISALVSVAAAAAAAEKKKTRFFRNRQLQRSDVPPRPHGRFMPWSLLEESDRQRVEHHLGYNFFAWNTPGFNGLESLRFDALTGDQADAAVDVMMKMMEPTTADGWTTKDIWDCWINHYEGYGWDELGTDGVNVQKHYETLGYTQAIWEAGSPVPSSKLLAWSELSDEERTAAKYLCYDQQNWGEHVNLEDTRHLQAARTSLVEVFIQTFALAEYSRYLVAGRFQGEISGDGPYTIAPPWDGAWEALPEQMISRLRNRFWIAHLQNLLEFHTYAGDLTIDQITESTTVVMFNEEEVTFSRAPGSSRVRINGELVLAPYDATNGQAYMLNTVLSPAWMQNTLYGFAAGEQPTAAALLEALGVDQLLDDDTRAFTTFLPGEEQFTSVPEDSLQFYTSTQEGLAFLGETLRLHVAQFPQGPLPSLLFSNGLELPTEAGISITITGNPTAGWVLTGPTVEGIASNSANIIAFDGVASNGIGHLLDNVLLQSVPPQPLTPEA